MPAYTKQDVYRPASKGRSLCDDVNTFFRVAMGLNTPVTFIINPPTIAKAIVGMPGEIKVKLRNIIFDIKESDPVELFGNNSIPSINIGNFVTAVFSENCSPFFKANRPPFIGNSGVVRKKTTAPTITTNNSDDNNASNSNKVTNGGRKKGS